MTNHGCPVCLQTIAQYTRDQHSTYVVTLLKATWNGTAPVCSSCGSVCPLPGPARLYVDFEESKPAKPLTKK